MFTPYLPFLVKIILPTMCFFPELIVNALEDADNRSIATYSAVQLLGLEHVWGMLQISMSLNVSQKIENVVH